MKERIRNVEKHQWILGFGVFFFLMGLIHRAAISSIATLILKLSEKYSEQELTIWLTKAINLEILLGLLLCVLASGYIVFFKPPRST